MKKVILFFSVVLVFCFRASSQFTPLPSLDENQYNNFVEQLHAIAKEQNIPELDTMAVNMSYDEARRFLAHPYIFLSQLRSKTADKPDQPALGDRTFGVIVSVLLNNLASLGSYYDAQSKVGFALGAYALWALSKVYFMAQLYYQFSPFGEKSSDPGQDWTETYKTNYLTIFSALLYSIDMQNLKFLIGAGPTISYMFSGTDTYTDNNGTDKEKFQFGSNDWQHFYAGFNFILGVMTLNNLMIYAAYTLPFTKLHDNWNAKLSIFRLAFAIPIPSLSR